ncbi:unnamed protein product [Porites evermanni]|uniref:Phosphatidylinositol N-acetylglucosaminyltransferase subunit H conserved domain-containing protein n=2 Tax=Porites evermanni TaxID=104178 RepID=A0ABN8S590_9CNID|nr:unnamed protein product [Porites evermanni]
MNKQKRIFEGSSIHGNTLWVSLKGDGDLSSSFVIEHSSNAACGSFTFIALCIIAVTFVLYNEFLTFTITGCLAWIVVLITIACVKLLCFNVCRESVLVVKDLGIQLTRIGAFGLQTSQFIEQHRVVDVIINEVITMHQVVFYLMLLTHDHETQNKLSEKNQQLVPLFTASMPCLETIKPIYHDMKKILGTR